MGTSYWGAEFENSVLTCIYDRNIHGYIASCNKMRVAYNHFYKWCPYCGRRISNVSRERVGNDERR